MTLPKLLDLNRVVIFKLIDNNPENCVVEYFYNHLFNFAEVRLLYDFCINDIIVLELSNAKMAHLLKISPTLLYKVQIIVQVSKIIFYTYTLTTISSNRNCI